MGSLKNPIFESVHTTEITANRISFNTSPYWLDWVFTPTWHNKTCSKHSCTDSTHTCCFVLLNGHHWFAAHYVHALDLLAKKYLRIEFPFKKEHLILLFLNKIKTDKKRKEKTTLDTRKTQEDMKRKIPLLKLSDFYKLQNDISFMGSLKTF